MNEEGYLHCELHDEFYDSKYWSCCEKCWANLKEGKN